MKGLFFATLLIILIFIFSTAFCPQGQVKVIEVIDGDTITVEGYDNSIRILGIDTLETKQNYKVPQQSKKYNISENEVIKKGLESKEVATRLLLNRCVELKADYRDKGKYGRYLRYVYIDGVIDYQEFMLINDLAVVYCYDKEIKQYAYYNSLSKYKCDI